MNNNDLTGFKNVLVQKNDPIVDTTTNLNLSIGSGVIAALFKYNGNNKAKQISIYINYFHVKWFQEQS